MLDPKHQRTLIIILSSALAVMLAILFGLQLWLHLRPDPQGSAVLTDNQINRPSGPTGTQPTTVPADSTLPPDTIPPTESPPSTTVRDPSISTTAPVSKPGPNAPAPTTPADPDAVKLSFYAGSGAHNRRFEAEGLYPGDRITQRYSISVSHSGPAELTFTTLVTEQTNSLGDVLMIRVTDLTHGAVLCDLPFSQANGAYPLVLTPDDTQHSIVDYQIDVYLSTSVGNEYQRSRLMADLRWAITDEGPLIPPDTGDQAAPLLWGSLMTVSALGLILLLLLRKRKEDSHET